MLDNLVTTPRSASVIRDKESGVERQRAEAKN